MSRPDDPGPERLRFDWYNHLTTLSLLIIGGIIGFMPDGRVPPYAMLALTLVALGGAAALSGAARIASGRAAPAGWRARLDAAHYAYTLVGAGAGIFIGGYFLPRLG